MRVPAILAAILFTTVAHGTDWVVEPSPEPFGAAEPGAPRDPDRLPDGGIATLGAVSAWYAAPTERYGHAILGDGVEAGALKVQRGDGPILSVRLPDSDVFEDRTPRLTALDGSGDVHVVTLLSRQGAGASVAIFAVKGGTLRRVAATPFIGRANRWRNIAGMADYDGDGRIEIAEVVTPHIGGTLRFWRWTGGSGDTTLEPAGSMDGFSNHAIGSREQRLSASVDVDGDGVADLAVPSADRRTLRLVGFEGAKGGAKTLVERAAIPMPGEVAGPIAVTGDGEATRFSIVLRDGTAVTVRRR